MAPKEPQVIMCADGYYRLEPMPSAHELSAFYESSYYDLIRQGGRAPELRRYLEKGKAGDDELNWRACTLYDSVAEALKSAQCRSVLEIGCGVGSLVSHLVNAGFDAQGVEPAKDAANAATRLGVRVFEGDYKAFRSNDVSRVDAIVLLNVLEHVPDPVGMLKDVRDGLNEAGIVIIRVPNDFSEIQAAASARLNGKRWWIASPDHINYFNFETLSSVLNEVGFDVTCSMGDFPMELFLLMGRDYTSDPELGEKCHKERMSFELSMLPEQLRSIYRALATVGIGRNCFVVARRANSK